MYGTHDNQAFFLLLFVFGKQSLCETVSINLFQGPLAIKVAKKAIDSGMQV